MPQRVVTLLDPPLCLIVGGDDLRSRKWRVVEPRTLEDSGKRVVILLWDRVVLVIMAAGARHRQPEKAARQRVDAVVKFVGLRLGPVGQLVVLGAEAEEAEARHVNEPLLVGKWHQVGRDLQSHEPVIRHVGVERVDDPVSIAVAAGVRFQVGRVRLILRVVGDIEPVAGPSLAVMGRIEQAVDHLFK